MFWNMGKQTRRKKSSKELRHEAQQIEIIVTQDNDDRNAQEVIPEIRVLHTTSKNLAFDDADEYIVGNDVFSEVHKWLKLRGRQTVFEVIEVSLTFRRIDIENWNFLFWYTVFENNRKSLIQYCERSERYLHFEWTKVDQNAKNCPFWRLFEKLKLVIKQCYQAGQFLQDKN